MLIDGHGNELHGLGIHFGTHVVMLHCAWFLNVMGEKTVFFYMYKDIHTETKGLDINFRRASCSLVPEIMREDELLLFVLVLPLTAARRIPAEADAIL